ncbi:MAG: M48 family peptidase [Methylococcales bacterium]|nr:MAG: M48 family peptidase [Methylococcales bacterium]
MSEILLNGGKQSVLFGQTEITYTVKTSDRKTLAIHVYPNGDVLVDAPMAASLMAIAQKVKKRASWIFKQQLQFAAYPPVMHERRYVSGESYRYLGRQYRLLIKEGVREHVKLINGRIVVETVNPENPKKIKALLVYWSRSRAQIIFSERYHVCVQLVAKLDIEHYQGFQLRVMPKRWGSCSSQGNIMLNPELIAAPKECIDYVITHELCHLKIRNHSQAFYKLLAKVMGDWERRRKRLNESVEVRFV